MTERTLAITRLPNVAEARLPEKYEQACTALAVCERIDECKDWADKAAALASYAKQADDKRLFNYATRIASRAIRRCGELLEQFQTSPRGGRPKENGGGAPTVSQRQAAATAGMSKDQEMQAVRVANVPAEDFEAAVESDDPPTITALAERGTLHRTTVPEKFREATHVLGVLDGLARFCAAHDAALVADALYVHESATVTAHLAVIGPWLEVFAARLPKEHVCT